MTSPLWAAMAGLLVIALAFVFYPLIFHRSKSAHRLSERRERNIDAYRSRLAELEEEKEAGTLGMEDYRHLRDEMMAAMMADMEAGQRVRPKASASGSGSTLRIVMGLILLFVIPAVSVVLYDRWGAINDLARYEAVLKLEESQGAGASGGEIEQLAATLKERLIEAPEDPRSWALLARTYMAQRNYADASWAYQQLADQMGPPMDRAAAWGLAAQAQFFADGQEMTTATENLVGKALELNPDESNSLGLKGIAAFEKREYQEVVKYWGRIIETSPDDPRIDSIRAGLAAAYDRMGEPLPDKYKPSSMADPAAMPGVTVQIRMTDALQAAIPAETPLFVYARRPEGGGPPLAVVRLSAGALPVTLRMTDRNAMAPIAKISQAESVIVGARLSPSGNPIAQSGDWQGQVDEPVAVSTGQGQPTEIVIDQQVP